MILCKFVKFRSFLSMDLKPPPFLSHDKVWYQLTIQITISYLLCSISTQGKTHNKVKQFYSFNVVYLPNLLRLLYKMFFYDIC